MSGDLSRIVARHVFVSGRVQGVFFRASARKQAMALSVTGWIRNLSDGRVEAVFEGTDDAVDAMVDWCREGPPEAKVEAIDAFEQRPQGANALENPLTPHTSPLPSQGPAL